MSDGVLCHCQATRIGIVERSLCNIGSWLPRLRSWNVSLLSWLHRASTMKLRASACAMTVDTAYLTSHLVSTRCGLIGCGTWLMLLPVLVPTITAASLIVILIVARTSRVCKFCSYMSRVCRDWSALKFGFLVEKFLMDLSQGWSSVTSLDLISSRLVILREAIKNKLLFDLHDQVPFRARQVHQIEL